MTQLTTAGARFRAALAAEKPLQIIGAINAYHAMLATQSGFKAIYLSGGGVAAGSLGLPDLGISTLEDVLIDVRRITDAVDTPLLVDIDTGWGGAFNIARSVKSIAKAGAAAVHIEDQVSAKRCGHRPNKAIVSLEEMVDRVKAAVDAVHTGRFITMVEMNRKNRFRENLIRGADHCFQHPLVSISPGTFGYLDDKRRFALKISPKQPHRLFGVVNVVCANRVLSVCVLEQFHS